ncbi:MAG: hypothetical protein R8P61_20110 [Bacteroidia bacterium]|nr:hypothetical protein [Bacteroidia bacterium]
MKESANQPLQIAHLADGDEKALESIRASFVQNNPGYDLAYRSSIEKIEGQAYQRILFVQEGDPDIVLSSGQSSKTTVGDIIMLDKGVSLEADSMMSVLEFKVPDAPADSIPKLIRPDWDMNITDVPGGCATERNAYRRILLTWKQEVGHYLYHALNAHRVRIMDSFSHYHPKEGGFDEFYLVQMALPEARIITSSLVEKIEQPQRIKLEEAQSLLQSDAVKVGDLIYLPRGTVHRGLGGVLAQVITVPGFIPGSEIGVDHHLKAINEHLALEEDEAIPFNVEASGKALIK